MNYLETNKMQWDKRTAIHKDSDFYDLDSFKKGRSSLRKIEREEIGDVDGKTLLHLQCHFGQDTISFARMGAIVTGIDISEAAIGLAQKLAKDMDVTARFVACNVYDTNNHTRESYDIVYTSYGTIVWLDDLTKWAEIIYSRLKSGGFFYMVDFHPFFQMFDYSKLKIIYPYFNEAPIEEFSKYTYTDGPELNMKEVSFTHSISEIINALNRSGLELEYFNEHDYSPYNCFDNMEERSPGEFIFKGFGVKAPHLFSMKWTRP